ncbi:MAG TPA: Fe-S oxidoreductase, partial [Micromonosporaceae bacterium]
MQTSATGVFIDWDYTDPGWVRISLALAMLVVTAAIAGRRIAWLVKLIRSGKKDKGRLDGIEVRVKAQVVEVFGQRKLLKWNGPGIAHFFTFWGFVILGITIVEAYGALVISKDFAFPLVGRGQWLGFLEDFFAVAVLLGIIWFAINRLRYAPERKQRESRFYGSHNGPAWVILGMIFLVVATLLLYRGAQYNTGHFPFGTSKWAFASHAVAKALGDGAYNQGLETFFLLAQMAVVFGFTIIVTYSKHLHIATAPLNVTTKRLPDAL